MASTSFISLSSNLASSLAKMLLSQVKSVLALVVITVLLIGIYYRKICGSNRELAAAGYKIEIETLTRLGSDLKFDQQSCPTDSVMTNSTLTKSSPLHDDCPTLFVVGARKGGSTSLIQYLSKHPEFKAARIYGFRFDSNKLQSGEMLFFNKRFKSMTWEEYVSRFPKSGMTGESSVAYLVDCSVPRRIFEYCGRQAKIVMLLRNPIDRYVSNFHMRARVRKMVKPIAVFTQTELATYFRSTNSKGSAATKLRSGDLHHGWTPFLCKFPPSRNMIYEGLYYIHLMNWLCNFPSENIMIINSEEFFQNTLRIVKLVIQFLGLRSLPESSCKMISTGVYNHGRYAGIPSHRQLTKKLRAKLRRVYEPFNKALFEILNWTHGDVKWT